MQCISNTMFVCVDIVCTGGMYCFIGTELKKKKKKKKKR